jgi:hypothetical protein
MRHDAQGDVSAWLMALQQRHVQGMAPCEDGKLDKPTCCADYARPRADAVCARARIRVTAGRPHAAGAQLGALGECLERDEGLGRGAAPGLSEMVFRA